MSNKFNQRIALLALNVGLILLSSFAASNVVAAECGQAKLVEAGSAGVSISQNNCQEQSRVTVGSVLELSPGSRMWLKFDPNPTGESFQLICQNRSASAINVSVAGTASPWIKAQGLKNCDQWKNNKLLCEGSGGEKNSFFCAIASAKPEKSKNPMEVTTSVKMRGILLPAIVPVEDVIKSIKPDIELCKNLYSVSEKAEMSWTVSLGIIKDLNVNSDNKDFIACVEGVVKQANSNQDVSVKHSF